MAVNYHGQIRLDSLFYIIINNIIFLKLNLDLLHYYKLTLFLLWREL
jgi:hypothetical protein